MTGNNLGRQRNKDVEQADTYHGCGFTVAFRCHLLRLVLLWQRQSAGVITAQSSQASPERHCQGPAIRYGTPNGYLGRMATINYHYSTLSSPLILLILYLLSSVHLFYSPPTVLSLEFFFICSPGP